MLTFHIQRWNTLVIRPKSLLIRLVGFKLSLIFIFFVLEYLFNMNAFCITEQTQLFHLGACLTRLCTERAPAALKK